MMLFLLPIVLLLNSSKIVEDLKLPETRAAAYAQHDVFSKVVPKDLMEYTRKLCADKKVPFAVYVAQISLESDWDAYCRSYNKASDTWDVGLGQINSRNFDVFSQAYLNGKTFYPLNPKENLFVSVSHFAELIENYDGDVNEALIAYNVGHNGRQIPRVRKIGLNYAKIVYNRLNAIYD